MLKHALPLFFLFLISCNENSTNQLVLIDEATSQPIEEWQSKIIDTDDISEWKIDTDRFYIGVEVLSE